MSWGGLPTGEADRWVKTTPTNPVVLSYGIAWEGVAVSEPSVLPPSLSPDGVNYWMWYRGGFTTTGIGVATSSDGRTWTKNVGNPIFQPNTAIAQFHVYSVGKIGGSYYAIFNKGHTTSTVFRYATSTDGLAWTDGGQALATTLNNWWYRSAAPAAGNTSVYFDGSTYHLFFEAQDANGNWQIGRATSSTPQGPYTETAGNPILAFQPPGFVNPQASGPYLVKIGSVFHMWYHSQPNLISGTVNSRIYRATSSSISGPWAIVGPVPGVGITESGAGLTLQDQTADPCVLEVSGSSYMWYDIDDNTNGAAKICLATFSGTLAQLTA